MPAPRQRSRPLPTAPSLSFLGSGAPLALGSFAAAAILLLQRLLQRRGRVTALVTDLVRSNPFLQAVLVPSALGLVTYFLAQLISLLRAALRDAFMTTITIENDQKKLFHAVIEFVSALSAASNPPLIGSIRKKPRSRKDWIKKWLGVSEKKAPEIEFRPSNENSFTRFEYQGQRVALFRTTGDTLTTGWNNKITKLEKLTLSTWGRNSQLLKELVTEALAASLEEESQDLNIYVISDSWSRSWEKATTKRPRPAESVILDRTFAQDLVEDARRFLRDSEWYKERGIPHRRGYLLHGPPGCGKSSTVEVIAGMLRLDICCLTLSNKNLDDNALSENMREAPSNAIILLEDVDAVFVERSVQKDSHASSVTFSGLLNAIDGVASQEGRMLFLTTNHIDRLDPALKRPGRCDVTLELRHASKSQMRALFLRFFPSRACNTDEDEANADEWVAGLPEGELSMAQLQGHLLEHRHNARSAIDGIPALLRSRRQHLASGSQDVGNAAIERRSVWDHLRLVGLERYAPFFEHQGATTVSELRALFPEGEVKAKLPFLSVELKSNPEELSRMTKMLSKSAQGVPEAEFADLAAIREAFLSSYDEEEMRGCEKASSSSIEAQSHEFCALLTREGKGCISRWQLKWLLSSHPSDSRGAIDDAKAMVQTSRPRHGARFGEPPWLSTLTFLRRCGMERFYFNFVDAGLHYAKDFANFGKEEIEKLNLAYSACGEENTSEKAFQQLLGGAEPSIILQAVASHHTFKLYRDSHFSLSSSMLRYLGNEAKHGSLLANMRLVHRAQALALFKHRCCTDGDCVVAARRFAKIVTDDTGRGLCSMWELERFFDDHRDKGVSDLAEAACSLITKADPVRPVEEIKPAEEPIDWVYAWLKGLSLEHHAESLIDAEIKTEDDLLRPKPLVSRDLEALGVDKIGERRKLMRAIGELGAASKKCSGRLTSSDGDSED